MWLVFPQIEGLGSSPMAQRYAIRSRAEVVAYLKHPILGDRLRDCVRLVVAASRPIAEVFSHPDDLKFRSCVTLFAAAAPVEAGFSEALSACCDDTRKACVVRSLMSAVGQSRDLAMFNLAIDSKLRGCDVVALKGEDVAPSGHAVDRATVRQKRRDSR
jgi:uncharacterized protein (DUF1810 family)